MPDFSPEADLLVTALQPLPIPVVITDVIGIVRSVNAALTSLIGFSAKEAVGKPITLLSFGTGERGFYDIVQEVLRSHEPWRGEGLYRRKNGDLLTAKQTLTSIECPNGEMLILVTIQGIAGPGAKGADARPRTIKETADSLQSALDAATVLRGFPSRQTEVDLPLAPCRPDAEERTTGGGTWVWNCSTGQIDGSCGWSELHGLARPRKFSSWEAFASILHPEDRARVIAQIENGLKNRSPHLSTKYRVSLPDGQIRWIGASGRCTYDDFGQPVRIAGVCLDITERERVEQFETEAERDFELVFNLIPDLACIVSADGYFKKVNSAWEKTLGYTREEVLSTPMLELIHPDDVERSLNEVAKQGRQYRTKHFVNRYRCKDGSYKIFDWRTTFNRDDSTRFGIAKDITEQLLWQESLRESEERFRIMADSCPTIIWVTDAEGRIQLANRVCREFFAGRFEQVDYDQWSLLIHPEDRSGYMGTFLLAVRERAPFRAEARFRRSDGEWRWIASHAEPRLSPAGEFLGHVGISPDITDRKQSEEALQRAKDAAEAANRSKSEFLANMSHEIRTPMNGVIGMSSLLLDTPLTLEQQDWVNTIRHSSDLLMTILNDILDFSKIEAGKLELERIEFDLPNVLQECGALLREPVQRKQLLFVSEIETDVPRLVVGDPTRLGQVLLNLLSNAVKFTSAGSIALSVSATALDEHSVRLRFEVRDSGIGMDQATIARLFKSFSQADTSTTRKYGGTGLGLAISKRLIELMGGQINVRSEVGQGTIFWFEIETETGEQKSPIPCATAPAMPGRSRNVDLSQRGLILLAEDNQINQKIAVHMLARLGFRVEIAETGAEAVRMAQVQNYDLILMDCQMPEMDGFAATEAIRKLEPSEFRIPIIAVTANAFSGDRDRCLACGMDDHLPKPITKSQLEAILEKWVGKKIVSEV